MRCVVLALALVLGIAGARAAGAADAAGLAGRGIVYAITETGKAPPKTSLYLREGASGTARRLYGGGSEEHQILLKIGGSDVVGAGRAAPPGDVYVVMGEASVADLGLGADALSRLRVSGGGEEGQDAPEPIVVIPLCFSEASAYGLWNRAPVFAVSAGGERFALSALRAGEERFERPAIRVLGADGREEWRILLEDRDLYVADLAWSPDGRMLAYLVMPAADEHTLEDALLPKAGLYLADVEGRTTRQVYECYGDAVAWGPRRDRVVVAARVGDVWSGMQAAQVVVVPEGRVVEEFSLRGRVTVLCYSEDGKWLAAQSWNGGRQEVWVYPSGGGWGGLLFEVAGEEGRLSLLGWARVSGAWSEGGGE